MNRYFALSRTTHAVLDIAAPAFCALLWLGDFPPIGTILLSLATAFAAYTSTYALNDLVGMSTDLEKFSGSGINPGYSVEASAQRYPLAQSILSVRSGWLWMGTWFALTLIGAYFLNPVIIAIFILASALEVLYCKLLKVTYLRTLVSGLVKTSGPISAVFVVDRSPAAAGLLLIFAWLFFWEIGGQNIPADWNDTVEDQRVHAKTVPVQFGFQVAGRVLIAALMVSVLLSGFLGGISPAPLGWPYIILTLLLGVVLLLRPALHLARSHEARMAARLFDSASYYPISQLVLIAVFLLFLKLS